MLWRKGKTSLGIVDAMSVELVETIPDFWMHENQETLPLCACSNVSAEKIFGASNFNNRNVVHFYEKLGSTPRISSNYTENFVSNMSEITCCEISYNEGRVYLGGLSKRRRR